MSEESTTPDLVELARLSFQPAKSRNFDAMMAFWADDPVWDLSPMGLGVYRGTAAVRGFFEDWVGSYELFEVELEECLDVGNGIVLSVIVQRASLAGSSGEVTIRYASVAVWEDTLIVSVTNYSDIDAARAAAERLAEERVDV
jgi:ketosteroid isomerase-like protein